MNSDSYGTEPDKYINKDTAKLICNMEGASSCAIFVFFFNIGVSFWKKGLITELLKKGAKKKEVQKLLDQIAGFKRKGYNK